MACGEPRAYATEDSVPGSSSTPLTDPCSSECKRGQHRGGGEERKWTGQQIIHARETSDREAKQRERSCAKHQRTLFLLPPPTFPLSHFPTFPQISTAPPHLHRTYECVWITLISSYRLFELLNCLQPSTFSSTQRTTHQTMTTSAPGTSYSQAFRDVSTSRTELIPTRFNKKTEERFILWKDIMTVFKNAERIKFDNEAVVFMIDENSE